MKIKRQRAIVMRNNRTEILTGTPRQLKFTPVDALKNCNIKSYISCNKAAAAIWDEFPDAEIIPVMEIFDTDIVGDSVF